MSELGKKLARAAKVEKFETRDWAGEDVYVKSLPTSLISAFTNADREKVLERLDEIMLAGVCDKKGAAVFDEESVEDLIQYGSIDAVLDALDAILDMSGLSEKKQKALEKNSETTPSAARLSA